MPKRSRPIISNNEDSLDVEQDKLVSPVDVTFISERTLDGSGQNGNKEIILKSKPRGHFKRGKPSMQNIVNLIFPKVKYSKSGYGIFTYCSLSGTTTALATETAVGATFAHAIGATIGKQVFVQYQHLPILGRLSYQTGQTYQSLQNYTATNQNISDNTIWLPNNGTDATTSIKGSYRSLFYNGGTTEHTFYNPGNLEITVEFWEVRPKRFLLSSETPLATLSVDKVINAQNTSGFMNSVSDGATTYLQGTDPAFTIEKGDHLFHEKFMVSKPKRVKVLGGETVKYFVKHPPFKTTNSPWFKSMIYGNYASQVSGSNADIDYAPFCTVWLLVRMRGQIVTTDTGAIDLTAAAGSTTVGVNYGACQLAHVQRETHFVRPGLYQQEYQEILVNDQQEALTATNEYIDNPLTDAVNTAQL